MKALKIPISDDDSLARLSADRKPMKIALVDSNRKTKLYPLPLIKLGAWLQQKFGDEVKLFDNCLPTPNTFDEIWITTVFTFDVPYAAGIAKKAKARASRVRVGGVAASLLPKYFEEVGAEVHKGLVPEAETVTPNWQLLPQKPEYTIVHTSRGCVRDCSFCMVPKLEGQFVKRGNWKNDIIPGAKGLVFYDNNWLVNSPSRMKTDVDDIAEICHPRGPVRWIDFNQGLDARLISETKLDEMRRLPISTYRFAFDSWETRDDYERAIRMSAARGQREFMSYVLYNHDDEPVDMYRRLRLCCELSTELRAKTGKPHKVSAFPMRFQPIMEIDKQRSYIGPKWTLRAKRGFLSLMKGCSTHGAMTCVDRPTIGWSAIQEFEFFFGKNEADFLQLIAYPKVDQLMAKRKGHVRALTAKARKVLAT